MNLLKDTPQSKIYYDSIPEELKERNQWIVWKLSLTEKSIEQLKNSSLKKEDLNRNHYTKLPYQVNGQMADSTDSNTWSDYDAAVDFYTKNSRTFNGLAYVISKNDPYTVVDLDECVNGDVIEHEAQTVINNLNSYTEYSQSGTGFHIYIKADKTGDRSKNPKKDFEIYNSSRFMIVTGNHLNGTPIEIKERQQETNEVYEHYFPKYEPDVKEIKKVNNQESSDLTEDEIIKIAGDSKNGMRFKLFMGGGWEQSFSSNSEADMSFANDLAFWTNKDFEKMDSIFRQSSLYRDKYDSKRGESTYGADTLNKAIQDCTNVFSPTGSNGFQLNVNELSDEPEMIPKPFIIKNGELHYTKPSKDESEDDEVIYVSRHTPYIKKEFHNIERSQVLYEVEWNDRSGTTKEVVPATTIQDATKLIGLSEKGFSVTTNNRSNLIKFIDSFIRYNGDSIKLQKAVERLGNIKGNFIHPLITDDIEIVTLDEGEKQLLESFEVKGTSESWKESVFERIKDQPKALLMVLASFASVVIKDLKIEPFIIDLSGTTSQGKTTTLRLASSVWGTNGLMSEWNATRVAVERKASFLNSFPLILDDTRKADKNVLQEIIYQFSGGRSKGRGSISGSQKESTWNNIMLSTGEVSINDYANNAGGVAARVIPLTDQPLRKDHDNIMKLMEGIEDNYGAVGVNFLKIWMDKKEDLIPHFAKIRNHYLNKAQGNEVLTRISNYYAAIHFTGSVLKSQLGFDVDLQSISSLFDDIAEDNKAVDKPIQLLEDVLTDLDSSKKDIFYHYEPLQQTKAVYKNGQLFLLISYVNEMLGLESSTVRREWQKRSVSIEGESKGKKVDYRQLKHKGKNFRVIPINMDYVEKLDFNFEIDER